MVEPDTVLLGKYRILRVLGKGGMGVVALAQHLHLNELMAIKFLKRDVLLKKDVVQRFLREAQAAVKLKSEHICRVFDVGTLDTGAPYMVMEYLEGVDLCASMKTYGLPPVDMVVDITLQVCAALAEAHALGIVHRDIKPANIFLTRRADGSLLVKVLDFGIATAPGQVEEDLTTTQTTLGTPAYMSPEQLRSSKSVDERADIWALGVVLYELLSGRRPFSAETFSALCLKVAMETPRPLDAGLPPGIEGVVMRCLEKDAGRRLQSVAELAAALAPYEVPGGLAGKRGARAASAFGDPAASARGARGKRRHATDGVASTTLSAGTGHVHAVERPRRARHAWWAAALVATIIGAVIGSKFLAKGPTQVAAAPAEEVNMAAIEAIEFDPRDEDEPAGAAATQPASDPMPVPEHPIEVADAVRSETRTEPLERRFTITTEPSGASVQRGGETVGKTPLEVVVRDDQPQDYLVTRRGYRSVEVALPDAADLDGIVALDLVAKERARRGSLGRGDTLGWENQ